MASNENLALSNFGRAFASGYAEDGLQRAQSRLPHHGPENERVSLPKADGGRKAWLFLAGCFFIEALTWGFPFSFGILQEYYSTPAPFSKEPSGIAIVGTSAIV